MLSQKHQNKCTGNIKPNKIILKIISVPMEHVINRILIQH